MHRSGKGSNWNAAWCVFVYCALYDTFKNERGSEYMNVSRQHKKRENSPNKHTKNLQAVSNEALSIGSLRLECATLSQSQPAVVLSFHVNASQLRTENVLADVPLLWLLHLSDLLQNLVRLFQRLLEQINRSQIASPQRQVYARSNFLQLNSR